MNDWINFLEEIAKQLTTKSWREALDFEYQFFGVFRVFWRKLISAITSSIIR